MIAMSGGVAGKGGSGRGTGGRFAALACAGLVLAATGCSRPALSAVQQALIDKQGYSPEMAACMATPLKDKLDSTSLDALVRKAKVAALKADDAKTFNSVQASCANILGYEVASSGSPSSGSPSSGSAASGTSSTPPTTSSIPGSDSITGAPFS